MVCFHLICWSRSNIVVPCSLLAPTPVHKLSSKLLTPMLLMQTVVFCLLFMAGWIYSYHPASGHEGLYWQSSSSSGWFMTSASTVWRLCRGILHCDCFSCSDMFSHNPGTYKWAKILKIFSKNCQKDPQISQKNHLPGSSKYHKWF